MRGEGKEGRRLEDRWEGEGTVEKYGEGEERMEKGKVDGEKCE